MEVQYNHRSGKMVAISRPDDYYNLYWIKNGVKQFISTVPVDLIEGMGDWTLETKALSKKYMEILNPNYK